MTLFLLVAVVIRTMLVCCDRFSGALVTVHVQMEVSLDQTKTLPAYMQRRGLISIECTANAINIRIFDKSSLCYVKTFFLCLDV